MIRVLLVCLLLALAACGGGARLAYGPGRMDYPQPGPPGDPWRPYIREASSRFAVPPKWIRAVMQQESGGQEYRYGRPITSSAGAMGLMQLMPATYADMQNQFDLGGDPYEPHDNILAGTAYIRLMYARYGSPAFLAAYNAGPQRLDDYLATGRALPHETADYVAAIAPELGADAAPIAVARPAAYRRPAAEPCDSDAAYDPEAPCIETAPRASALAAARTGCVQDAAYDPDMPCRAEAAAPVRPALYEAAPAQAATPAPGAWAVQVGAYRSPGQAHFATTMARSAAFAQLAASQAMIEPTSRFGGAVLYRARLAGLAREGAAAACGALSQHSIPCMIVAPGG